MRACVRACVRAFVRACVRVCYPTSPIDALHLRHSGSSPVSRVDFFEIHPATTLSMNNLITICSYYVQLSATLCQHLRTIIHNVMRLFYDCPKLCNTRAKRR